MRLCFRLSGWLAIFLNLSLCAGPAAAQAGWLDKVKQVVSPVKQQSVGDTQVGKALREALEQGIDAAVAAASKEGGYLENTEIRIPFPERLSLMEKALRGIGMGETIDRFEQSVNQAAESAAPKAKDILVDVLFKLSIEDAEKILTGGDTAATEYFEKTSRERLYKAFHPTMKQSVDQYKVSQIYDELLMSYKKIPFAAKPKMKSAHEYATNKALDGLFHLISQEETRIRTDPKARATELLKTVFK